MHEKVLELQVLLMKFKVIPIINFTVDCHLSVQKPTFIHISNSASQRFSTDYLPACNSQCLLCVDNQQFYITGPAVVTFVLLLHKLVYSVQ